MAAIPQLDRKQSVGAPAAKLVAAFAAVYILWGGTYLAIKFAIQTIPPLLMASARYLMAGSILYAYSRSEGHAKGTAGGWRQGFVLGGMLLLFGNGGLVLAERTVPSGLAAVLFSMVPIWVTLLGWILPEGKRPSHQVALGIVLGFVGVIMLIGPGGFHSAGGVDPVGAAILIVASMSWAAGSLYGRRARVSDSPVQASGIQMLAGGALLLVASLVRGEVIGFRLTQVSLSSAIALLCLAVLGSIVAFTAYAWLIKATTPARVSTHAYVNPAVAVLLGHAIAREPLTARTVLSAGIIVTAIIVITTARREVRDQ